MANKMTNKEIIKVLKNEISCREEVDFKSVCESLSSCSTCEYYNTEEVLMEAYKNIIEILNTKDRCEDDGK